MKIQWITVLLIHPYWQGRCILPPNSWPVGTPIGLPKQWFFYLCYSVGVHWPLHQLCLLEFYSILSTLKAKGIFIKKTLLGSKRQLDNSAGWYLFFLTKEYQEKFLPEKTLDSTKKFYEYSSLSNTTSQND